MLQPASSPNVLVVGAGIAGLTCAGTLAQAGCAVRVLERSRGVGGRCATRRVDDQPVDHGAPYLHGAGAPFLETMRRLALPGLVPGWPQRVREPQLACQPDAFGVGVTRWAIQGGMSILPKRLAEGLDVRLGQRVIAITPAASAFDTVNERGERLSSPVLVLAASLAQTLRLLEPLAADWPDAASTLERLRAIECVPVLTAIAGYAPDSPEPGFDAWNPFETTMVQMIVHDSAKRDAPAERVLVVHARPRFARLRLEDSPLDWGRDLLWETAELLGHWASEPRWLQPHRWSSGRVRIGDQLTAPVVLRHPQGGALVLAGDAFGGAPGLEGAWTSGVRAAEECLALRAAAARA